MTPVNDRLQKLMAQNTVAGIDFIHVDDYQKELTVFFFKSLTLKPQEILENNFSFDKILITSMSSALQDKMKLDEDNPPNWIDDTLVITVKDPGDFILYRLKIDTPLIDPYFNDIIFSFKVNCPSGLDCKQPDHECSTETLVDFPIDYMARDFLSFRRALLEYASFQYPDWKDRLEADAGVMLAEVMSALGDEMAYYQDRIAREAYLETASQRRSVRRHARLVDYHLHDGAGATGWLDITVKVGQQDTIVAGTDAWLVNDAGRRINFEVGEGLYDTDNLGFPTKYPVDSALNSFDVHRWDEDETCLPIGETSVYIVGNSQKIISFDWTSGESKGKWVLLITETQGTPIAPRAHCVKLIEVKDGYDPVQNVNVTKLTWAKEQALPFEMDMRIMKVRANLIPISAGKIFEKEEYGTKKKAFYFTTGCDPDKLGLPYLKYKDIQRAVERRGHDDSLSYFYSLEKSDEDILVWSGGQSPGIRPEIRLFEGEFVNGAWRDINEWNWKRSLLGTNSSGSSDRHFTLDDGFWKPVVKYQRFVDGKYQEIVHEDYATGLGVTIRFGDNEFGMTPVKGTLFRVIYRLGGGKQSNVAANSILNIDRPSQLIEKVTNPFPTTNGMDPESLDNVRRVAPEAFRAITYRAVRPEDYAEAAERLDCVQRAGSSFRWTGSWLSAFVTPDPSGAAILSDIDRIRITEQLDRFRQAGREAFVLTPVYADLNLYITICVKPDAFQGEVKQNVLEVLFGKKGSRSVTGYFCPDHFTFGTSLDRSSLEAAIHHVEGVRSIENICIERRGWFGRRFFDELCYEPGKDAIIRIDNDPLYPERGIVKLTMKGGA